MNNNLNNEAYDEPLADNAKIYKFSELLLRTFNMSFNKIGQTHVGTERRVKEAQACESRFEIDRVSSNNQQSQ
jgi:hypothetical protein